VKGWTFADFQETTIGEGWHKMALAKLLEGIERKESITLELYNQEPWDFFMVVFGETDTVSHHFWMFHDPDSPRHRAEHETAIQQVYQRLDETVGKLLDASNEDVVVGVVSDHGFGGAGTGVVYLNNWLAENGFLEFTEQKGSLLKKLALTVVPESIRGTLFRRFQGLASKAESQSRFSGINFSQTAAWSEELNYFPSIRVNLRRREPDGQVSRADYDSFCRDLCSRLESWEVIEKAWRRDELYAGPYVDRAPDIILELALENGYSHSCLRSRGGENFRRIEAHEHIGGKEKGMNGNHRAEGVFFLSIPFANRQMSLTDVAPTVYEILSTGAPDMDGRSILGGKIEPAERPSRPKSASAYTPEQEEMVESRLRDLGYFE
jgi:predicted AlkP superfamily phosphohydrolase/phosphomutase